MQQKSKRKRFGADLEDILHASSPEMVNEKPIAGHLEMIMVTSLVPGTYQPRRTFDETAMRSLADSIKEKGMLQPIIARKMGPTDYEIIAGERRWRAAQMAGLQQVPVIIKEMSNENVLALGIIENIQREDLNPIEEAQSIKRLLVEFKLTQEQVAKSLGRPRTTITNMLRLLELSDPVKRMLEAGKIQAGHARAMLTLPPDLQNQAAAMVEAKQLSVRATEALVKWIGNPKNSAVKDNKSDLYFVNELKRNLEERIPADVSIQMTKGGGLHVLLKIDDPNEIKRVIRTLLELPLMVQEGVL